MVNFRIDTNTLSDEGLFANRRIHVGGKTFDTPAAPIEPNRKRRGEHLDEESLGLNEIYRTLDGPSLLKEQRDASSKVRDHLGRAQRKTGTDEVDIVFMAWEEDRGLEEVESRYIVALQSEYSDFLTVPFHVELTRSVDKDRGKKDPGFREYYDSVCEFLETARKVAPDKPVMGVLPALGWVYSEELLALYDEFDVQAFVLNLDRRRPTAATQVSMVKPLMQHIARQGIAENVLMYGINMNDGQQSDDNFTPADDFAALGMGLGVAGGNHVGFRAPAEVIEDFDERDGSTFEFFDPAVLGRRQVPLENLPSELPSRCSLEADYVVSRAGTSMSTHRRLEKLVSADLRAKAARDLQSDVRNHIAFRSVAQKRGATAETQQALREIRQSFDEGLDQSGLGQFS